MSRATASRPRATTTQSVPAVVARPRWKSTEMRESSPTMSRGRRHTTLTERRTCAVLTESVLSNSCCLSTSCADRWKSPRRGLPVLWEMVRAQTSIPTPGASSSPAMSARASSADVPQRILSEVRANPSAAGPWPCDPTYSMAWESVWPEASATARVRKTPGISSASDLRLLRSSTPPRERKPASAAASRLAPPTGDREAAAPTTSTRGQESRAQAEASASSATTPLSLALRTTTAHERLHMSASSRRRASAPAESGTTARRQRDSASLAPAPSTCLVSRAKSAKAIPHARAAQVTTQTASMPPPPPGRASRPRPRAPRRVAPTPGATCAESGRTPRTRPAAPRRPRLSTPPTSR